MDKNGERERVNGKEKKGKVKWLRKIENKRIRKNVDNKLERGIKRYRNINNKKLNLVRYKTKKK